MSIDYDQLSPDTPDPTEPPAGIHDALLQRASLVDTSNGQSIVTEWTAERWWWTAWFGFEPNRLRWTIEFLDAVGLDRRAIANARDDTVFQQMLDGIVGDTFRVQIERKGKYTNTYVLTPLTSRQQQLEETDVPIDVGGLPEPVAAAREPQTAAVGAAASAPVDDEDIPF